MTEGENRVHSPAAHTHRATDDQWAELERLALAASPHEWEEFHNMAGPMGVMTKGGTPICHLAIHGHEHDNAAYIAAANPATVLKLIEAATANSVGMSAANAPNPPPKEAEPWRPDGVRSLINRAHNAIGSGKYDRATVRSWLAEADGILALPSPPDQKKGAGQ